MESHLQQGSGFDILAVQPFISSWEGFFIMSRIPVSVSEKCFFFFSIDGASFSLGLVNWRNNRDILAWNTPGV